jgi:hypothetical protein
MIARKHPLADLLLAAALASSTIARAARADELRTVLGGRIERVVAAGSGVAVLRGGEVVLVDGDGRFVARCGGAPAPTVARPHDGTALEAEEVLRLAGLSEEDISPEAEELVDDEGVGDPARRRIDPSAAAPPRALSLAGTADAVWIGTSDGLLRFDARTGACARAALGGRMIGVVAAAGQTLVAAADTVVWRSDDGGASFRVATALTSAARTAAVTSGGDLAFVADAEGVVELTGGHAARRVLDRPADALVACGAEVLTLAGDAVYRIGRDGDVEMLGPRPPTRALACSGAGEPLLVAAGVGRWTSHDGRAWVEDADSVGVSFVDVALTSAGPWLATEGGLRGPAPSEPEAAALDAAAAPSPRAPRIGPRPLPRWSTFLPRVTVAYSTWSDSQGRAGWRCWALLTFWLDRRARARGNAPTEILR